MMNWRYIYLATPVTVNINIVKPFLPATFLALLIFLS